ncbi:MAG: hypothetical protein Ct9H300mP14_07620 [Gammaproteobacteria bacterium]|nr:MAG: hypothetical protein Ct9H300mP14_07620 [Gammaproteobacteria bacterium]
MLAILGGEIQGDGELVEVGWWNVADLNDLPMRGVTRFMLDRAVGACTWRGRRKANAYFPLARQSSCCLALRVTSQT